MIEIHGCKCTAKTKAAWLIYESIANIFIDLEENLRPYHRLVGECVCTDKEVEEVDRFLNKYFDRIKTIVLKQSQKRIQT